MRVELITTGTELLLGRTLNTHVCYIAEALFPLGLRLQRQTSVPDGAEIGEVLREAFCRTDLLIVTGGLGPTHDDMTREITAEMLGRELRLDTESEEVIRSFYAQRGRELDAGGRRQAMAPHGSEVLPNPRGTAPGLYLEAGSDHPHLFLLPGPPRELYPMFENEVMPRIRDRVQKEEGEARLCREWSFVGIGESDLARNLEPELRKISGLEIGYCAKAAAVNLRCLGFAEALAEADALVARTYPCDVIGDEDVSLEEVVVRSLERKGKWVSVAESCTGGLIAHRLTNVSGASAVIAETHVTYGNAAKARILGVPGDLLENHGAVSREVARAMAEGCRRVSAADFALAVTGIAGPTGGSEDKPVGTVFIGLAADDTEVHVEKCFFPSDRETFKLRASQKALDMLRRKLLGFPI